LSGARCWPKAAGFPKNNPVLIYCNTGSLSAQAAFALRVSGWESLRILQGGFAKWKAKEGLDANEKPAGERPKE
jgi:3-mercaptopyruvate sulfurtransferase SseA